MACEWNLDTSDEPDEDTHLLTCCCRECGKYGDLDCERDFRTGKLVVQVRTCFAKGGSFGVRDECEPITP